MGLTVDSVPREPQTTPPRYEDLPDMCSPEDARAFLQIGRNAFYDLLKAGEIPSKRFGRLIRIPKTALVMNGSENNGHE